MWRKNLCCALVHSEHILNADSCNICDILDGFKSNSARMTRSKVILACRPHKFAFCTASAYLREHLFRKQQFQSYSCLIQDSFGMGGLSCRETGGSDVRIRIDQIQTGGKRFETHSWPGMVENLWGFSSLPFLMGARGKWECFVSRNQTGTVFVLEEIPRICFQLFLPFLRLQLCVHSLPYRTARVLLLLYWDSNIAAKVPDNFKGTMTPKRKGQIHSSPHIAQLIRHCCVLSRNHTHMRPTNRVVFGSKFALCRCHWRVVFIIAMVGDTFAMFYFPILSMQGAAVARGNQLPPFQFLYPFSKVESGSTQGSWPPPRPNPGFIPASSLETVDTVHCNWGHHVCLKPSTKPDLFRPCAPSPLKKPFECRAHLVVLTQHNRGTPPPRSGFQGK